MARKKTDRTGTENLEGWRKVIMGDEVDEPTPENNFVQRWTGAIKSDFGREAFNYPYGKGALEDAEESIPTEDNAPTPSSEPPVALPAVFTEAQEERIRELIKEELANNMHVDTSSYSGYYGEKGLTFKLLYGPQYYDSIVITETDISL